MNQSNFDKVLLTTLVLIFAGLAFRGYHLGNGDLSTFAADNCKLFSGALLTLITGRALATRNGDNKNTNGGNTNVPESPASSNSVSKPLIVGK